ncbi:MAG TPA: hypothetical protein DEF51_03890 [Myxococcales bacterium]|nr:hypothetical protein [Myxococcales bacterium]
MASDDKTDRFRAIFEPEDIFERFVKNANASTEEALPRDDEPTGMVPNDHADTTVRPPPEAPAPVAQKAGSGDAASGPPPDEPPTEEPTSPHTELPEGRRRRGGPPTWDHAVTVRGRSPYDDVQAMRTRVGEPPEEDRDGTRPDAPIALAMARAFDPEATDTAALFEATEAYDGLESVEGPDSGDETLTVPRGQPLTTDSGQRILLLTKVKRPSSPPSEDLLDTARADDVDAYPLSDELESEVDGHESVVAPRGLHTQRIEAAKLVPDVEKAAQRKEDAVVAEGVEDGQMPTRELDQILSDMSVLLRYGHQAQVRERLALLRRTYPEDLLLLRRLAEFFVEHAQTDAAMETLFALAGGLFERRNVEGMRQALEQVLVLEPGNERAYRLLGLLERRPADGG